MLGKSRKKVSKTFKKHRYWLSFVSFRLTTYKFNRVVSVVKEFIHR